MADKVRWTDDQQQVIDLRNSNILVSAAAGSGKTAVLVERILQRITAKEDPINVDQLLVVTFTRAAAAQMKERLAARLEKQLIEEPDNEHLARQTTLIHHAQITTIDGFCGHVVRNYFHQIDLDPAYRMMDEGEQKLLLQDVMTATLEAAYETGDPAFLYLAGVMDTGRDDTPLRQVLEKLYTHSQSHPWPDEWLKSLMLPYEAATAEELMALPFMDLHKKQADALVEDVLRLNERALDICRMSMGPIHYEETLLKDREALEELMGCTGYEKRADWFARWKAPTLKGKATGEVREELIKRVKDCREDMKKKLGQLRDTYYSQTPEEILSDMRANLPVVKALVDLALKFSADFAAVKRDKNLLDFSDVEHMALNILVDQQTKKPTGAARELARGFAEVMIDEYQDSNDVQEAILSAVSGGKDQQNNRFMVGDVKQSIYKFRQARPELFLEKYKTFAKEEGPDRRIDLSANFRSRHEVTDAVNQIFAQIMTLKLGGIAYDEAAQLYPLAAWPEDGPFAPAELLLIDREEEGAKELGSAARLEGEMIAARILDMVGREEIYDQEENRVRPVRYRDITILLRSAKDWAQPIVSVLKDRGIPAYSPSRAGYLDAPEIACVLSLLMILDNPRQEIPFTAVMTSPMGGFTSEELAWIHVLAKDKPIYECARLYLKQGEDEGLRNKLKTFLELYERLRKRSCFLPVHELIREIYDTTGYLLYQSAMPGGEQKEANLRMLQERAFAFEKTSYQGLFHFVRYIENMKRYNVDLGGAALTGEGADQVQVMTIHNSKGLEFPIVFAAGLGKGFNTMDVRDTVLIHGEAGTGLGLSLVDPVNRTKKDTLYRAMIGKRIKEDILGEELRVLYVALTRARQRLIMTAALKDIKGQLNKAAETVNRRENGIGYSYLYEAKGMYQWILAALCADPCMDGMLEHYGIPVTRNHHLALPDAGVQVGLYTVEALVASEICRQSADRQGGELIRHLKPGRVYHAGLHRQLKERLDSSYPYETLRALPAKCSVSDIKHAAMAALDPEDMPRLPEEELFEEPPVIPCIPAFMRESETTEGKGAYRGTVYHRFMELLDYRALKEGVGVRLQLEQLKNTGRMAPEDTGMIRVRQMENFLNTQLGKSMTAAALEGRLYREQQFFLQVPAALVKEEWKDTKETILIQGVIDAYYETEEGLVLVDYKTDRIKTPDGSELVPRYRRQLELYKLALEQLTERPVTGVLIYSFAANTVLPVE